MVYNLSRMNLKNCLKSAINEYLGVHRATPRAAAHVSPTYSLRGCVFRNGLQLVFSIARFNRYPRRKMLELRQEEQNIRRNENVWRQLSHHSSTQD